MNAIGTAAPLALDNQDDYSTLTNSDPYDARQTYASTKRTHDYSGGIERDLKSPTTRRPSVHSNTSHGPRKRPSRSMRPPKAEPKQEEPTEDSPWIHRDKLAQIEIQEMEEAGMHVRQPNRSDSISRTAASAPGSRSVSRTGVRRAQSRDRLEDYNADGANEEAVEAYNNSYDDFERKRISVIHAAENEDEENIMHNFDPEVRTQEELAADHYTYRQPGHAVRPSTSRIPISKTAASNSAEQDSVPRSGSGNGSNGPTSWEQLSHAQRRRTGSVGSGILLDEAQDMSIARPESSNLNHSSPERLNNTTKATTPKSKKEKTTNAANKNRTPSKDNAKNRPTTSHKEKPEKPEGEAPWIASMYKPDPRLPPDQQLLPTVAKRMMQEQWEREGKPGNPYDRQSRILNTHEDVQRSKSPQNEGNSTPTIHEPVTTFNNVERDKENIAPAVELDATQPLTGNQDRKSDSGSLRPGTSGGYRITPPPATTPPPLTNRTSATSVQRESTQPNAIGHPSVVRVPEVDEKEEVKKGCCCVMM